MADSVKKRCRKSKLVAREDDIYEDEFHHDESTLAAKFLQDQRSVTLGKIKDKINNEVSYESGMDRSSRFSIAVEVEPTFEMYDYNSQQEDTSQEYIEELSDNEIERLLSPARWPTPLIIQPDKLSLEMSKILSRRSNMVDKKIEVAIRNQWVTHLNAPKPDGVDALIQEVLAIWRHWACMSKNMRQFMFTYKCMVCSIGWWHLGPFREHIKRHDNVKLSLDTDCHEGSILASCGEWFENMCKINVEGPCWRCLKTYEEHEKKDQYVCTGCQLKFGACFQLFKHEGQCQKYQKIIFESEIPHESFYKCELCQIFCVTLTRYNNHMNLFHDVRSDLHSAVDIGVPKTCALCNKKFWMYNSHFCSARMLSFKCQHCYRRFPNKFFLYMHNRFAKETYCDVCNMFMPKNCMELEHYVKHSKKYTLMHKCLYCKDHVLFHDDRVLYSHLCSSHTKMQKKKDAIGLMALPLICLAKDTPTETSLMNELAHMVQGKNPKADTPVYPLGFDATFDKLKAQERKELADAELLKKSSEKQKETEEQVPGCSKDFGVVGKEELDDDNQESDILNVEDDTAIDDINDYDNIDDDRIEEEEIEIQKFLEQNIAIKQEVSIDGYRDSDDSPVMIFENLSTLKDRDQPTKIKQERSVDGDRGSNDSPVMIFENLSTLKDRDQRSKIKQERSVDGDRGSNDSPVMIFENLSTLKDRDQRSKIKQERLSVDGDRGSNDSPVMIFENLSTLKDRDQPSKIKQERLSVDGDRGSNDSPVMIFENLSTPKDRDQQSKIKQERSSVEDDKNEHNVVKEINIKQEIICLDREDECFEMDHALNIVKEDMDQEMTNLDQSITVKEEINDRMTSQNEDETNTHVELETDMKDTMDVNEESDDEVKIKEEPIDFQEHELNITQDVIDIKTEKDTDDLQKVFQCPTDFVKVLNESEKELIEPNELDSNMNSDEGSLDEYYDDDIIVLNEPSDANSHSEELTDNGTPKRVYYCKRCDFSAPFRIFKVHKDTCRRSRNSSNKKHKETYSLRLFKSCPCTKCGKSFHDVRSYLQHLPIHDIPEDTCPVCFVSDVKSLASHVTGHVKQSFLRLQVLDERVKECITSKRNGLYQCKVCPAKVDSPSFFEHWEYHLELKSEPDESKTAVVEAVNRNLEENDYTLKSEEVMALLEQLQTPEQKSRKACVLCDRKFARKNDTKRHCIEHLVQSAHALNPYGLLRCQHCSIEFVQAHEFKSHLRILGGLPVFRCEICNITFSCSSNFAKHKKAHNYRILICDICKKKFASRIGLEKHLEMHATTKPLFCESCNKTFYAASALRKHNKSRHSAELNRFCCKICHRRFPTLKKTWDHLWDEHKERKFKADCPICDRSFRRHIDVVRHCKSEHSIRPRKNKIRTKPRRVKPIDMTN